MQMNKIKVVFVVELETKPDTVSSMEHAPNILLQKDLEGKCVQ